MLKEGFLTQEEKDRFTEDYLSITEWAVSEMIEEFSHVSGRIAYTFEELQDEAIVGFVKALDSYDKSKNAKFLTYAYSCMRNEVLNYIYKHNNQRYLRVRAYYESIGAYDKIEEYDKRSLKCCDEVEEYKISEDDINMITYNSIKFIENAQVEGLISYLEKNLKGTAFYVFHNYINPYGDFKPKMYQKEIAKKLGISQPAVSKAIKKIESVTLEFIKGHKQNLSYSY